MDIITQFVNEINSNNKVKKIDKAVIYKSCKG